MGRKDEKVRRESHRMYLTLEHTEEETKKTIQLTKFKPEDQTFMSSLVQRTIKYNFKTLTLNSGL